MIEEVLIAINRLKSEFFCNLLTIIVLVNNYSVLGFNTYKNNKCSIKEKFKLILTSIIFKTARVLFCLQRPIWYSGLKDRIDIIFSNFYQYIGQPVSLISIQYINTLRNKVIEIKNDLLRIYKQYSFNRVLNLILNFARKRYDFYLTYSSDHYQRFTNFSRFNLVNGINKQFINQSNKS